VDLTDKFKSNPHCVVLIRQARVGLSNSIISHMQLLMMVVFVGCGEDDLGSVAKVTETLPAIGNKIDPEGILVVIFNDSSNAKFTFSILDRDNSMFYQKIYLMEYRERLIKRIYFSPLS